MITWDQRGHGGTRATGAATYWDSAAGLLTLLGRLGVERAVLADMSQSGFLSLRAALTGPGAGAGADRQWAPDDLGQLKWLFRCLMDRGVTPSTRTDPKQ